MGARFTRTATLLFAALLVLAAAASAQEGAPSTSDQAQQEQPEQPSGKQQLAIDVPRDGVLYNERGELVVGALLTNAGEQALPPMNVIVLLLNECILTDVPQTCRFAAFGSFQNVAPNGIPPGSSVRWVFNFGPYPRLDLDRWTVIWYPLQAAAPAGTLLTEPSE